MIRLRSGEGGNLHRSCSSTDQCTAALCRYGFQRRPHTVASRTIATSEDKYQHLTLRVALRKTTRTLGSGAGVYPHASDCWRGQPKGAATAESARSASFILTHQIAGAHSHRARAGLGSSMSLTARWDSAESARSASRTAGSAAVRLFVARTRWDRRPHL